MKRGHPSTRARASVPASTAVALESAPEASSLPSSLERWPGHLLAWVTQLGGQLYALEMGKLGLSLPQVPVLQALRDEGPMVQARLSERTQIDKATMVGVLNALEGAGLVERRPHPRDRRAFEVALTEAGRAKVAEFEAANVGIQETFFAPLTPEERQTLQSLLYRLAEHHTPRDAKEP